VVRHAKWRKRLSFDCWDFAQFLEGFYATLQVIAIYNDSVKLFRKYNFGAEPAS
jgi:hypothetical protein